MERPIFSIRTFNQLQRKETKIVKKIGLEDTPTSLLGLLKDEIGEFEEAVALNDKAEMMREMGDILMICARIASVTGFRLMDSVTGKARRNHVKYNPDALVRLQKDWGMTAQEAMTFAKSRWDRNRDEHFFRRFLIKPHIDK